MAICYTTTMQRIIVGLVFIAAIAVFRVPAHYAYAQSIPGDTISRGLIAPRSFENVKDDPGYVLAYKDLVIEEFGQDSVMVDIARCESTYKQYEIVDNTIKVLRGKMNPADVGLFQINVDNHELTIQRGGYNIYTPKGNIEFAKYLYEKYGTRPWNASKKCWN